MESNQLTIRNAGIIYRNFSGVERQYNPAGRRNFSILITDPVLAESLANDGWLVKEMRKKNPNSEQHWHLPVAVVFDRYPPNIFQICGDRMTKLNEANVGNLDFADIVKVDLTIHPSKYTIPSGTGYKAYLRTMYVTIREDELFEDYSQFFNQDETIPF